MKERSGGLVAGGGRSSGGRRGEREGGQESWVLCVDRLRSARLALSTDGLGLRASQRCDSERREMDNRNGQQRAGVGSDVSGVWEPEEQIRPSAREVQGGSVGA